MNDDIQQKYDELVAQDMVIDDQINWIQSLREVRMRLYDDLMNAIPELDTPVTVEHHAPGQEPRVATITKKHTPGFPEPYIDIIVEGKRRPNSRLTFGDDVSQEKIRRKK